MGLVYKETELPSKWGRETKKFGSEQADTVQSDRGLKDRNVTPLFPAL